MSNYDIPVTFLYEFIYDSPNHEPHVFFFPVKPKPIDYEPLKREEVDALPERVKLRLSEAMTEDGEWLVVRSSSRARGIVERMSRLSELDTPHASQLNASRILEQLTSWIAADLPSIEKDLVLDNLAARRDYLNRTPVFTALQIHDISGLDSRNKSEPASRWHKEGKTFGIRVGQPYLYPAFQFHEGRPREAMKHILAALPNDMTAWERAFWFASGNGWLDGDIPEQCLDNVGSVIAAARQLSNLANG